MPSSSARATALSWSRGSPRVIRPPTAPHPNDRTDTLSPVLPSCLCSIVPRLAAIESAAPLKHGGHAAGKGGEDLDNDRQDRGRCSQPHARIVELYILSLSSLIFRSCHLAMKFGVVPKTAQACSTTPRPQPRNGHCTHQTRVRHRHPIDDNQQRHHQDENNEVDIEARDGFHLLRCLGSLFVLVHGSVSYCRFSAAKRRIGAGLRNMPKLPNLPHNTLPHCFRGNNTQPLGQLSFWLQQTYGRATTISTTPRSG